MKHAIAIVLIFATQNAFADFKPACTNQANAAAEQAFEKHLEEIPNAVSPEGIRPITYKGKTETTRAFSTTAEFFYGAKYGYSYEVEAKIDVAMSPSCGLKAVRVSEKILNVTPPADEIEGTQPCFEEVGLICEKGMVDRCNRYPQAKTHHCVPDIK